MRTLSYIAGYLLLLLYGMSWTSILWNITGYREMTMWYWIAYFGDAIK